jgi:serine protease Do
MSKKLLILLAVLLLPVLVLSGCSLPALSMSAVTSQSAASQAKAPAVAAVQATAPSVAAVQATAPASAPASGDVLEALQEKLGQIYEQVNPSVVNIQVILSTGSATSGFEGIPNMPQIPGFPSLPQGQSPSQQALASGFVWDKEGHIVTNNHVVESADKISVTFSDNTVVPAEVVGTDPDSDLAVIKVDVPADELQPVTVADSTGLKVGQLAVAIGNPFGLEGTMTVGFVSALGRSLPVDNTSTSVTGASFTIPDVIQTDAPINPGNSGGVLVNDQGQLIGVPTAIESQVGQSAGIGFAVPTSIVQKVVPALIQDGSVQHPWIGISGMTLTSELATAMGLDAQQRGVLVGEVTNGSPADKAGLRGSDKQVDVNGQQVQVGGDVIVAIDGQQVQEFDDLVTYLSRSANVGDTVALTILRDGNEKTVDVTLAARPSSQGTQTQSTPSQGVAGTAWLGIEGLDLTPAIAGAMDLAQDQQGVLVEQVVQGSPADEGGLRGSFQSVDINGQSLKVGGDVIVSADNNAITSLTELRAFLADAEPGQRVELTVLRDGKQVAVDVTLAERPASTP